MCNDAQDLETAVLQKFDYGFSRTMAPYMLLSNTTYQFQVLAAHSESLSSLSSQKVLAHVAGPLTSEKGENSAKFYGSANTDDALAYGTHFMFDCLRSPVLNSNLYSEGKEWSKLLQSVLQSAHHPQVFKNMTDFVVAVFKATRRFSSRPNVLEQDEDKIPVIQLN